MAAAHKCVASPPKNYLVLHCLNSLGTKEVNMISPNNSHQCLAFLLLDLKLLSCLCFLNSVAYQSPLSMEFSRQEDWSGLPFPSLGIFPMQGSNLGLLHCRQIPYIWATGMPPVFWINLLYSWIVVSLCDKYLLHMWLCIHIIIYKNINCIYYM